MVAPYTVIGISLPVRSRFRGTYLWGRLDLAD